MHINGVDLAVRVSGDGAPLIWGHGLMGRMQFDDFTFGGWRGLHEGVRFVRYDARGHGASSGTRTVDDYLWSRLAQDMLAVADEQGLEHFAAGGQSMGSATALFTALAAPQRIMALVLMNPPTAWETRAAQSAHYTRMADAIEREGVPGLLDALQDVGGPPWQEQRRAAELEQWARLQNLDYLPYALRGASLADLPPRETLRTITLPTLILAWDGDPSHPLSTAEQVRDLLPHSTLEVAQGPRDVGKWPQRIHEFLTRL